jgi:beta-mannosidase
MNVFRALHDGWTVSAVPGSDVPPAAAGPHPASVPGCVHTDLLAAGVIEDPYLDDNELRLAWIARTDWCYETSFEWTDDGSARVDLVCDGLDTVATVTLNGVEVARTANMHRSYAFDVRGLLHEGENRLAVRFDSAYRYAEAVRESVGERPNSYPQPFQYIRKMACNFGWDWGPTLVTAGIWQRIGLRSWSVARLARVRALVSADGHVDVRVTLERASDDPVTVTAQVDGVRKSMRVPAGETEVALLVEVPDVRLWWPRGYGEPARYELTVSLAGDGALDRWSHRIGFRTVRLDTTPDANGSAFTVVVNDVPVFVKGANWIPDDAFPVRVDRARYDERLDQAAAAGVNFLRVWGGGRYESAEFYDAAAERGLMVGQDFLFACAAYPEEQPIAAEVEAEAREQVARLAAEPSLVLWTGNNENIWGWYDWNWRERLAGRSWGRGYYLELLPSVVAELDPTRPYWPGSPYSGSGELHPNDPAHGTTHVWDVWNTRDYTHYRTYRPRFVAEFGFQGPPAYATLRRAVRDDPLAPDSPGMAHHQKAEDGNGKLLRGLAGHLPVPGTFDDWHYATQLNQARAVRFGVEHFRSLWPLCSGTVVWQLNDCWPVTSWSAVDGDGRRKPLWYALRQAYAERLVTIQPRDGTLALVLVNDGLSVWSANEDVVRSTLDGQPRGKVTVAVDVPPRSAVTALLRPDVAVPEDPTDELLVAGTGPGRALWFFAEDVDLRLAPAAFESTVEPTSDGYRVIVTARTLLRDLALFPDRLDPAAEVDEQLVTLLPGESATFNVHSRASLTADRLTAAPVLRCVNQLVAGHP